MDELLDRIAAGPPDEEIELLRVYADQLIQRGDPLGELIVVATERLARDTPELARREAALITERTRIATTALARPHATNLRWKRGFIDSLEFVHGGNEPLEHAVPRLAALDEARLLRRIEIDTVQYAGAGDLAPVFAVLAKLAHKFPRLVELVVREGMSAGDPYADGPIALHDVTPIYTAFPRLEILELDGDQVELGHIALPALRRLMVTHLHLDDTRRIVAADLPNLVDLELAWAPRSIDNVAATFGPLMHREFPRLEALSLAMPTFQSQIWMVAELADAPIMRRVRRLAFRGAKLGEGELLRLMQDRPKFTHLERLELLERPLSASFQKKVRKVFGSALVLV